jgi:SAM-dependent methyltransferase
MQSAFTISRRGLLRTLACTPLIAAAGSRRLSSSELDRAVWNKVYVNEDSHLSYYPNRFLAEVVQNQKPGRALDIGMGQGRNSLYLARLGWQVTGVDVSDQGIDIARKEADRLGLKIRCVVCDFSQFDVGKGDWDLVVAMYLGRIVITEAPKVAEALSPGGLLAVEHYRRDVHRTSLSGGRLGYPVNSLLEAFAPTLRIVRYEEVFDFPDWGDQGEKVPLVRMLAAKG